MDEFLIFGKPIADPWHRVCSLRESLLLMVEFCQIQGPRFLFCILYNLHSNRPLYSYPLDVCSPHLLEDFSVWLMSSENSHGNYSQLYNQQLGILIKEIINSSKNDRCPCACPICNNAWYYSPCLTGYFVDI